MNEGPVPPDEVPTIVPTEEGENIQERIQPTLSDPHFTFVVARQNGPRRINQRTTGIFESWEKDSAKWMSANFHIFAYQTENIVDGRSNGQCNMLGTIDGQTGDGSVTPGQVLLYNRIMRINNSSGAVTLYKDTADAKKHGETNQKKALFMFPTEIPDTRFKFFTYFAAGAEVGARNHYKNCVTQEIRIDGTQDIMHAFAYHTYKAFDEHLDAFRKADVYQEELSTLYDPSNPQISYSTFLYSCKAARFRLQPIFRINHLLARFNIYVRGGNKDGKKDNDDYKNITITGVKFLNVKNTGTLVIADDSWEMESYRRDSANIIRWHDNPRVDLVDTIDTVNHQFTLTDTTRHKLAVPMMLPPSNSVTIQLEWVYAKTNDDGTTTNMTGSTAHEIKLPLVGETSPQSFVQGASYNISIFVYGPQDMSVDVEENNLENPWNFGGTISVDDEGGYRYDTTRYSIRRK